MNCTIENNTSWNGNNVFSYNWQGTVNIYNSIIVNSKHGNSAGLDIQYVTGINLIYGSQSAGTNSLSGTNFTSSPSFTDAANDDYSLQSGSPAIDAANSTYANKYDINNEVKAHEKIYKKILRIN